MRPVNLLKVATEAEILRIRQMIKRQGIRVILGLIAVLFCLFVLALINVTVWLILRGYTSPIYASLIMVGLNLLFAVLFAALAAKSSVNSQEKAALQVRQRALQEARNSLALTAVVPVAGSLLRVLSKGRKQATTPALKDDIRGLRI